MALIKCKECGKEISDKAKTCINCGCPLNEKISGGEVRIKMPNNVAIGWAGLFSSREAIIKDDIGNILWKGHHGENAKFVINVPTNIIIDLGSLANNIEGLVEPQKKYSLIQDMGVHWLATYILTEVDYIDSD